MKLLAKCGALALGAALLLPMGCTDTPTEALDVDLLTDPSFAVWDHKITGGGEMLNARTGRTVFIQVSAMSFPEEGGGGAQGQVNSASFDPDGSPRSDWHGTVEVMLVATDPDGNMVVALCGTLTSVRIPGPFAVEMKVGDPFGVAIKDVVDGVDSESQRNVPCTRPLKGEETVDPLYAEMVDGDFRVR